MRVFLLLPLAALLALPSVSAGSQEAPEVTDPAGDCVQAWGNEYADIVAAWISNENDETFDANIALNKWNDALGTAAGFTLQFEHQDVQFGAVASYLGPNDGWDYSNAYIDLDTGQTSEFVPADGSFTPGSPAIITIEFDKDFFPHNRPDNALRNFQAGSADFKAFVPLFVAPVPVFPPEPAASTIFDTFMGCDLATSDAEYVFTVGGHSMHEMAAEQASDEASNATEVAEASVVAPAEVAPEGDAPAPGLALVLVAGAALVGLLRRRSA